VRIALISDVHGNLPALEAVLDEIARAGAEETFLLGDLLGHLGFPEETAALVRARRLIGVVGNIDLEVLRAGRGKASRVHRITFELISAETVRWVGALPWTRCMARGGATLLLTHGTPRSPYEYFRPDTRPEELRELLGGANTRLLACGHTHLPVVVEIDGVLHVNPGSVGRPVDGDGRASYALVEFGNSPRATVRRVAYDVERTAKALRDLGFPESLAESLRKGVKG
jgi:putative phosphoesterase